MGFQFPNLGRIVPQCPIGFATPDDHYFCNNYHVAIWALCTLFHCCKDGLTSIKYVKSRTLHNMIHLLQPNILVEPKFKADDSRKERTKIRKHFLLLTLAQHLSLALIVGYFKDYLISYGHSRQQDSFHTAILIYDKHLLTWNWYHGKISVSRVCTMRTEWQI